MSTQISGSSVSTGSVTATNENFTNPPALTNLAATSVNAVNTANNLAGYSTTVAARINTTSIVGALGWSSLPLSQASGNPVGNAQSSVVGVITGSSCTVDLFYNSATAYCSSTLTFPTTGTYLVYCNVWTSTYSTSYSNGLTAYAIRIG